MTNPIVLFITLIVGLLSILSLFLNYQKKKAEDINAKKIFIKGFLIVVMFIITLNVINPLYYYFYISGEYDYQRGNFWLRKGDKDRALPYFNKAIQINPKFAGAYLTRGIIYTQMGIYQKALEDFNEAIHLKSDYAEAYEKRAFAYFLQGNKKLGCSDVQKVCELGYCGALEKSKENGYCR